jgi:RNA polymerase sigma factor (TIGR02999 family)
LGYPPPEIHRVPDDQITGLLAGLRAGQQGSFDRLLPLVYDDLRRRAHAQLARRRVGDTLSTTALVHEAFLKLAASANQEYNDRIHFFAVASRAMRQILVDYARASSAAKRGGGVRAVSLDVDRVADVDRAEELVTLDEALVKLEEIDPRLARIVELRFFGGLSVEEAGEAMAISPRTVKREWRKARALLFEMVRGDMDDG